MMQPVDDEMTTNQAGAASGSSNKLLLLVILAAGAAGVVIFNRPAPTNIAWGNDLRAAMETARTDNNAVLVAFVGQACPYCTRMDREVLTDPKVEASINRFVPVRLDLADAPEAAARYEVYGIPAYRVITPDGEMIARTSGYQPVQRFMRFLQYADLALSAGPTATPGDR